MNENVGNSAVTDNNKVMIELKGVNKWYGEFHVLKDINLTVTKGERIVVNATMNNERLNIAIVDKGPGVPDSLKHQIFEPFFTTKTIKQIMQLKF